MTLIRLYPIVFLDCDIERRIPVSELGQLFQYDLKQGLLFIAALIIVAVFFIQKFDWIVERLGIKSKRQLAEEKQDLDIKVLKDHAAKTDGNIDKILQSVDELKTSIGDVSIQVQSLQKRIDENEISKLSDRITQNYRYYNSKQQWTEMEKWAFNNICNSYLRAGGNSFVRDIAIPRSKEWEVIDE